MTDPADAVEGWFADPYGQHEDRWYSVGTPTSLVRDGDRESRDPPPDGPAKHPDRAATSHVQETRTPPLGHERRRSHQKLVFETRPPPWPASLLVLVLAALFLTSHILVQVSANHPRGAVPGTVVFLFESGGDDFPTVFEVIVQRPGEPPSKVLITDPTADYSVGDHVQIEYRGHGSTSPRFVVPANYTFSIFLGACATLIGLGVLVWSLVAGNAEEPPRPSTSA